MSTDYRERAARERGELDGIVMAMLSAGLDQLVIDRKHALWSYEHLLKIERDANGNVVYKINRGAVYERGLVVKTAKR